jgi:hypothetical protein
MKLKWVRRDDDDPNTILCIYDDADRASYIDLQQVGELHRFIKTLSNCECNPR